MKQKTLYKFFYCGAYGEIDAFFVIDKKLELFYWWSCGDAIYRSEYMDPLFAKVGVTMQRLPEKFQNKAARLIEEDLGE
jgi:hypothetical protein